MSLLASLAAGARGITLEECTHTMQRVGRDSGDGWIAGAIRWDDEQGADSGGLGRGVRGERRALAIAPTRGEIDRSDPRMTERSCRATRARGDPW